MGAAAAETGDGLIHILVTGGLPLRPHGVRIHRTRILTPSDGRIHEGLPVTSPARNMLDIAELVTERQLELAFDRGLVSRILRAQDAPKSWVAPAAGEEWGLSKRSWSAGAARR